MKRVKTVILCGLLSILALQAETLNYNLYVSAGFVSVRVGESSLTEAPSAYNGTDCIRTEMTLSTGKYADKLFSLRDTMISYNSCDGYSLFYRKSTNENSRHDVETAVFTRDLNTYSVNLQAKSYDGVILGSAFENSSERIYDMLSMLSYARSLNSDGIDVGHTVTLPMVNGTQVVRQYIVYEGNKSVKADNGTTYNCLVLSIRDKKYGEERETLKAYVTANKEHLPIQLNIKLGVGYIKALYRE